MQRTASLRKFSDVLDGLGLLPGEHSLTVDPTVTPEVHLQQTVPYTPRDLVKKQLNKMESQVVF